MHFVLLFVFLKAVRGEEACDLDGGPQKQRSLLQNFAENDLQPGPRLRLKVLGYNPDERPEEVQSKDTSLCEEDIFARPELCPAKCPYAAEMKKEFCHFRCVERNQCGLLGTVENATIPDDRLMVCMPGYSLTEEGECQMKGLGFFIAMAVISVVAVILVIVWYVLISMKPCVNPEGVAEGYESRERTRLTEVSGEAYPLTTNLLSTNVAGVGTMALFRYQFALLIWAITLLLVWFGFVIFEKLKGAVKAATGVQPVAVSVAWDYAPSRKMVEAILEQVWRWKRRDGG
eukprot:g17305.t1